MFEELEAQRGEQAKRIATNVTAKFADALGNTSGVYQAANASLGTGYVYDDDGEVVEPEGGYWKVGTPVGTKPIQPY